MVGDLMHNFVCVWKMNILEPLIEMQQPHSIYYFSIHPFW